MGYTLVPSGRYEPVSKLSLIPAFASLALILSACANPDRIPLRVLVENPSSYFGQEVATCGWKSKQFENVNLYLDRKMGSKGLGMEWCEEGPLTTGREWGCVRGTVGTLGDIPLEEVLIPWKDRDEVAISTGIAFDWVIKQKCLNHSRAAS